MKCLVTAGPTYEPLDQVRRLTNFSTGQLGSELANFLTERGHQVTILLGEQATWRGEQRAQSVELFTTTKNLQQRLSALANQSWNAVFHAAAVSDFAFGKVWRRSPQGELIELKSGKFSTRDGTILAELVPTPKLLRQLRNWFGQARIVGWKYEVEGDRERALAAAREQLVQCRTDGCVVNGPGYGDGFSLVRAGGCTHCASAQQLLPEMEKLAIGKPA